MTFLTLPMPTCTSSERSIRVAPAVTKATIKPKEKNDTIAEVTNSTTGNKFSKNGCLQAKRLLLAIKLSLIDSP